MAIIRLTLGTQETKKEVVRATGTIASNNVVIEWDDQNKQLDVDSTIEKLREIIIETFSDGP